jgi:hypothetical protein
MKRNTEQELDALFASAKNAFPEIEPSPDFMAEMWAKIEDRRAPAWMMLVSRWSPRLALAGSLAAAILTFTAAMHHQSSRSQELLNSSYVDVLTSSSFDADEGSHWVLAGRR